MANYLDETGLNQYTTALKDGTLKVGKAGEAEKVAAANIDGVIPLSKIPKGAVEDLHVVANQTAMLALTKDSVQNGDTVKLSDTGLMYFVKDETKLGTMDAFEVYAAGSASKALEADHATNADNATNATNATNANSAKSADEVAWSGIKGKPATYPADSKAISSDTISAIIAGTYTE